MNNVGTSSSLQVRFSLKTYLWAVFAVSAGIELFFGLFWVIAAILGDYFAKELGLSWWLTVPYSLVGAVLFSLPFFVLLAILLLPWRLRLVRWISEEPKLSSPE
jgi:hypothetical protein